MAPAQSKAKVAEENQALEEAMEAMLALGYKATELKKIKKFFEGTLILLKTTSSLPLRCWSNRRRRCQNVVDGLK